MAKKVNIQNESLKGKRVIIGSQAYTGDANGVFSLDANDAKRVVGTPGWISSKTAADQKAGADPTALLKERRAEAPPKAAPEAPKVEAEPDHTKAEPEAEPEADDGPDLDSMGKEDLLATALEYGVELTAAHKKLKVAELRKHIDAEIYGAE